MFILDGTPKGFRTISIGVPSSVKGISSAGRIRAITPLLPWRPPNLSPTSILRIWATKTWICIITPAFSSWPPALEKTFTPTTLPCRPVLIRWEVSRTSLAFSPKIALSKRSSLDSSCSPLGVILPTKMSPGWTSAPMRTMPSSSRWRSDSSLTLGISRVTISGPSLVSLTSVM